MLCRLACCQGLFTQCWYLITNLNFNNSNKCYNHQALKQQRDKLKQYQKKVWYGMNSIIQQGTSCIIVNIQCYVANISLKITMLLSNVNSYTQCIVPENINTSLMDWKGFFQRPPPSPCLSHPPSHYSSGNSNCMLSFNVWAFCKSMVVCYGLYPYRTNNDTIKCSKFDSEITAPLEF